MKAQYSASKFFSEKMGVSLLLSFLLSLGASFIQAQESGPNPLLARNGYTTESYNLIEFETVSLTDASTTVQLNIPVSQVRFYAPVASAQFAIDQIPANDGVSQEWITIPQGTLLVLPLEAASGSYIHLRNENNTTTPIYFYGLGRLRY